MISKCRHVKWTAIWKKLTLEFAWHHGFEHSFKSLQNNKPWWSHANQKFTSSGFLQFTDTPVSAGKLALQKPGWIALAEKDSVLNSRRKGDGGSKMTLQRQLKELDKAAWIKNNWYLSSSCPDVNIRFLSLNFGLERWVISKAQPELKCDFTFLGLTPKEVEISEQTGIIFFHRIIDLDRSLDLSGEKSNFTSQKDGWYCFNH